MSLLEQNRSTRKTVVRTVKGIEIASTLSPEYSPSSSRLSARPDFPISVGVPKGPPMQPVISFPGSKGTENLRLIR